MLFEAAPRASLALRADAGFEVVFVNRRYLQAIGAKRENLVGRPLFEVLSENPRDPAAGEAANLRLSLERVMRSASPDDMGLHEIRAPDGDGGYETQVWKRVNTPVLDEDGRLAFILHDIEDVTALVPRRGSASSARSLVAIADSDAASREKLDVLLREAGFDTVLAADAASAMEACLNASPALLVIDVAAPGIGGLEMTRRLRADERTATLPIMLLAERSSESVRIDGYDAGADEILEKPHSARELIARIGALVRLSRARAEIAGRQRRIAVLARLASVVETAMDAVISIDTQQKITLFNAAAEQMFGCKGLDALGKPLDIFIPRRFRSAHANHVEAFARTGVSGRTMGRLGDLTALRADGREFPIEASISQARVDGETLFTVILRDISERKAAAETQRLLIGELDHRVKNTLAMVQAIANQTAKAYSDPQVFVENFNGRVRAMAGAHTLLTRAGWKGADLGDLIREQLTMGPFDSDQRIVCQGPEVFLSPQFAMHFGMVLYELGANARKYGALAKPEGQLAVHWTVSPAGAAELLEFEWVESGGPPIGEPIQKHFGTRLIESSLTHSLHGKVELDFASGGLVCKVSLPLPQNVA
ncbi:HWE histidine kinase domain-containing protein [Rhodoblastus sp.]